jgi:crotonobetainyl-CoA:carnitine CoA-transferase CaiB-like acyl-CoA transferase
VRCGSRANIHGEHDTDRGARKQPTVPCGVARRSDEVEAAVGAWTRARSRLEVAERLQSLGIEAVPVADFGDIYDDPQVAHRDHLVPLTHTAMGPRMYEHNGFRVSGCAAGDDRAGPLLGQDNDWVQTELLGLSDDERARLAAEGVFK